MERLSDLYDELLTANPEHGDVAIVNQDNAWCMSAHRDGRLVFEQLSRLGNQRHLIPVPKAHVLELWLKLIDGDIEGLLAEPWKPGYVAEEEAEQRRKRDRSE